MSKSIFNLKRYYLLILNGIMPFIIFFVPILNTTYIDEEEKINLSYNFYQFLKSNNNIIFTILMLLMIITALISLTSFVILMIDSYKLLKYRKTRPIFIMVLSSLFLLISLVILIFVLCKTVFLNQSFVIYNSFNIGSVLLFIYSIIQFILILIKLKYKEF